jgi:hypothetical protein
LAIIGGLSFSLLMFSERGVTFSGPRPAKLLRYVHGLLVSNASC